MKIQRILCPVDFSEFSVRAYQYAQWMAKHYRAKLFLQHVLQPLEVSYPYYVYASEPYMEVFKGLSARAEQELQQFETSHRVDGVDVEPSLHRGAPTDCILSFASNQKIDLIIMGTHGYRAFDRLMLGSVTDRVLRKAFCPVLVVRRSGHALINPVRGGEQPVRFKKILLATDFSQDSERASHYAFSLARDSDAELTLLHVLEDMPSSADLNTATLRIESQLRSMVSSDVPQPSIVNFKVRFGRPYQEIAQLALETETDLIILGVHSPNLLNVPLLGSTTYRVIQFGSCPVLSC